MRQEKSREEKNREKEKEKEEGEKKEKKRRKRREGEEKGRKRELHGNTKNFGKGTVASVLRITFAFTSSSLGGSFYEDKDRQGQGQRKG